MGKKQNVTREQKRTAKRYKKVEKKLSKAKSKSPKAYAKANKKYGYNYEAADKAGIKPDSTGHWPSRNPETGEILKGRKHPTIKQTKRGEKSVGYKIYKKGGKLYSKPKKRTVRKGK